VNSNHKTRRMAKEPTTFYRSNPSRPRTRTGERLGCHVVEGMTIKFAAGRRSGARPCCQSGDGRAFEFSSSGPAKILAVVADASPISRRCGRHRPTELQSFLPLPIPREISLLHLVNADCINEALMFCAEVGGCARFDRRLMWK